MLQSQATRTLDPYRTLQLHPTAPRALIVEAYWHLASRRAPGRAPSAQLDDAYALLTDGSRRQAYDAEHGHTRAGRAAAGDYYELLHVSREADAEIVALAYGTLAKGRVGALARATLATAYRTLSHPQLRAQYDASRGAPVPCAQSPRLVLPATIDVPEPPAPAAQPPPPSLRKPPESARRPLRSRLLFGKRGADAPARRTMPRLPTEGALEAAKDARLRALAVDAPLGEAAAPQAEAVGEVPSRRRGDGRAAELVFIRGAFEGRAVELSGDVVTLGSAPPADLLLPDAGGRIAPEHARVWAHGEHFVLHRLAPARTDLSGRVADAPLVVLEDGDEFQIGEHRIAFRQGAQPGA